MKTFDHGYEEEKDGKGKGKKGIARKKLMRYIASLSPEQISRMTTEHTQKMLTHTTDPTAQMLMRSSMDQNSFQVQAKLEVSQPGDAAELQADKVADAVSKGDINMSRMTMEQTGSEIMMKGEGGTLTTTPEFEEQLEGTKGQGEKMHPELQAEMENHLGADLSDVNIHTGQEAAAMSEEMNAQAFAYGNELYFNSLKYDPHTKEGKKLLAHELTHAVQQKGGVNRKVMRAMKFEFQTNNQVLAVEDSKKGQKAADYTPKTDLLPRKYTSDTVGYGTLAGEERGDKPAYLSVGSHGLEHGEEYFEEPETDEYIMKEEKNLYKFKLAQFYKYYKFVDQKTTNIIGKKVSEVGTLKLYYEHEFKGHFHPDTFSFHYKDKNGKKLDVHLDEDGRFQHGEVEFMKVKKKPSKNIDKKKNAQYEEVWKVSIDPNGTVSSPNGKIWYKVEQVGQTIDHSKNKKMAGMYNTDTYEKKYYLYLDFSGNKLRKGAKNLDIHIDKDHVFRNDHKKFMLKKEFPLNKEQTGMELQSETSGVIEFETPKWFNKWDDLELRIIDALHMIDAINNAHQLSKKDPFESKIIAAIETRTGKKGHKIVKWPENKFSISHLKNLKKDNRSLYVQISDPAWEAKIQVSESLNLSNFGSLLTEHRHTSTASGIIQISEEIFQKAWKSYSALPGNSGKSQLQFKELKGFVQLIVYYIYTGQVVDISKGASKFAFSLMARTNFSSMYKNILSPDEQAMFKLMIGKESDINDNPIFTQKLNDLIKTVRPGAKQLNRDTPFYFKGHKGNPSGKPKVYDWLKNIQKGKDELAGTASNVSDAMGAKEVNNTPGDNKYKHALFEVRGTKAHGADSLQQLIIPAINWLKVVKEIFDAANIRTSDTPDDPTTKLNEASKTGLKND
jgi:hypothetical protein